MGGITYDLRFDEIKGTLVDKNPFVTGFQLLKMKMTEANQGIPKDIAQLDKEELPILKPNFEGE